MIESKYLVAGMTCDHCVHAVTAELSELPGVTDVKVELAPDSDSTVVVASDAELSREQVVAALDEAGDYRLSS